MIESVNVRIIKGVLLSIFILLLIYARPSFADMFSVANMGMGDVSNPFFVSANQLFYNPAAGGKLGFVSAFSIDNFMGNVAFPHATYALSGAIPDMPSGWILNEHIGLGGSNINGNPLYAAAFGVQMAEQISFGMGAHYFRERTSADIGIIFKKETPEQTGDNYAFSAFTNNIGSDDPMLPRSLGLNIAYAYVNKNDLSTYSIVAEQKILDSGPYSSVGIELAQNRHYFRAGIKNSYLTVGYSYVALLFNYDVAYVAKPGDASILIGLKAYSSP